MRCIPSKVVPAILCLFGAATGLLAGVPGSGVAAEVCFFAGGRSDRLFFRLTGAFAAAAAPAAAAGVGGCLCWLFAGPNGLLPAAAVAGTDPAVANDSDWR